MKRKRRRAGAARTRQLRRVLLAVVALGATGLAVVAYETNLLRSLELSTVNTRFTIRGNQRPPANIVLVEIDERTFDELDLQWPFPRRVHAKVIEAITRDRPKAIAYDVQFSEASACPISTGGTQPPPGQCPQARGDETALLEALNNAGGRAVMTTTETEGDGKMRFLGNEGNALLDEVGSRPANGLLPTDPGGVLRRVSFSVGGLKTLAVVSAEVADGHRVHASEFDGGPAWIDYYGPENSFHRVSFSTVYLGHVPRGFFHGKIVVVGPSAPTLQDIHATSTARQMPGAEVQASAITTVLRGLPLRSSAAWLDLALIVLLGCATPLATLRFGSIATVGLALALAAVFTVGVQVAFDNGHCRLVRLPARGADPQRGGGAVGAACDGRLRARAGARPVLALRARERRRRGAGKRGWGTAPRWGAARGNGDVHRSAWLHLVRGNVDAGPRDRSAQPLPERDERCDPRPRRHAGRIHGGWDHGRVRSADRAGRPRRPRALNGPRDARRAPAALQRMAARTGVRGRGFAWASA